MDLGIKGKRALVLGASRGLGAAIAKSLAAEGADVIAAARNAMRSQSGQRRQMALSRLKSWTCRMPLKSMRYWTACWKLET